MTSKHTPGPWKCVLSDRDYPYVYAGDKSRVASCGGTHPGFWKNVRVSKDRQNANARLIAAAPDLLDALQQIAKIEIHEIGDFQAVAARMQMAALSAIAKAEGR